MQAVSPLANLTLKHKIIAMAIGAFSAIALSLGLNAPAGASANYGGGGVDLSAYNVDASSFSENTTYNYKALYVVYVEENYTNSVEYSNFSLSNFDLSQAGYGGYGHDKHDKKDWKSHY